MSAPRLPPDHPARSRLAAEVHARPPAAIASPAVASCLALLEAPATEAYRALRELAADAGSELPQALPAHAVVELPEVRVKWERHGEFVSFTFVVGLPEASLAGLETFPSAFASLPPEWLVALPGQTIAATDILLLPELPERAELAPLRRFFNADALAGASVLDGAARIFTDFVATGAEDGVEGTRWLVLDNGMGAAQSARVVQRIIEIEIYRLVALLALPLAREALPALDKIERRLAEITSATAALQGERDASGSQREERRLLDELTRVAAEVEHSVAETAFRFAAGQAYWELVRARVGEFREQRVGDMRTIGGFLSRRLAPAMNSAAAAARRQDELSARIERASTLLRTRVDVALEEQNQRLLVAMDRRSEASLRIQQAVEGLSIAAITYYAASLVAFLVKPLTHVWHGLDTDWIVAASVPVIALVVWRSLNRLLGTLHE
jgi:uncharacterized membrane-anchored protein